MLVVMVRIPVGSDEEAERLVGRFRNRAGMVDNQPGFMGFELLKGEGECVSVTRWASREALDAWMGSQAHAQAHGAGSPSGGSAHGATERMSQGQASPQASRGGQMQGNVTIYEVVIPGEGQA